MDLFVLDLSGIPMLEAVYYDSIMIRILPLIIAVSKHCFLTSQYASVLPKASRRCISGTDIVVFFFFVMGKAPLKIVARPLDLAIF